MVALINIQSGGNWIFAVGTTFAFIGPLIGT